MPSLKDNFEELLQRIKYGRKVSYAGFEPVYYLVFSPSKILEVKRQIPAWKAKLEHEGWDVHFFSVAEAINDIFRNSPLRKIWLKADTNNPKNWDKINKSLRNGLVTKDKLKIFFEEKLNEVENYPNAILIVTDLEALHPYMRIGAIEGQLQGKFKVPTILLYPGERVGKSKLKFLGFYPGDGNYRSVHVGG